MPTCTNKFPPCGHNFGGCLARIAIKGAVDIFSYTRFQRTGPRWFPTSSAGAAEPTGPSVPSGKDLAGPDLARTAANDAVPSGHTPCPRPGATNTRSRCCFLAGMSRSPAPPGPNYAGRERARKNKTSKWLIKRIKQPHGAATTTHHWMCARSRTTWKSPTSKSHFLCVSAALPGF